MIRLAVAEGLGCCLVVIVVGVLYLVVVVENDDGGKEVVAVDSVPAVAVETTFAYCHSWQHVDAPDFRCVEVAKTKLKWKWLSPYRRGC